MTDLRFTIPNQMRRNFVASRLKREGFEVESLPSAKDSNDHVLDVLNVQDDKGVEEIVIDMAPDARRSIRPEPTRQPRVGRWY